LADPNLARAIAADAAVGPPDRVLEVGAGLGSLTVALARTGAHVLAIEFDRQLVPALREVVGAYPNVHVEQADATRADWDALLGAGGSGGSRSERAVRANVGPRTGGAWTMVSNLPYNVAVPLMLELLESVPRIRRYLVMVQRAVGDRFSAGPGEAAYGTTALRVEYRARAEQVRRVPAAVFWPRPAIDSAVVRITPRRPPVDVDPVALFRVVDEAFAERRKTVANALRRLGLDLASATRVLGDAGVPAAARGEQVGLEAFARVTSVLLSTGWRP
jgi:16S rRNA (adenine1518-N6/adenine1519-N6)-dimethyltransferase